jgi:protoheme IX farnesyltransferase
MEPASHARLGSNRQALGQVKRTFRVLVRTRGHAREAWFSITDRWIYRGANLTDLMVLFKVRIVFLLLLAALGGAFVAAHGVPPAGALSLLMVSGALSAMGSSAINEYIERERDARMLRTRRRPLASGAIARPEAVLAAAAGMIVLAVGIALVFNPALAFFLRCIHMSSISWLKPRTSLNIVIGGAAGVVQC